MIDGPSPRYTLFSDKREQVSHIVWHAATGHWPKWPEEVIHHIDENRFNNEFGNLQLMTNEEHSSFHNSGERHSNWKGDNITSHSKYIRKWRARRNERDRIPEQEILE